MHTARDPGPSQIGTNLADALVGDTSPETLSGLAGKDVIFGGRGADILIGGLGADQLVGGPNRDVFDFNSLSETGNTSAARDLIADFSHKIDVIDLSTIDASTVQPGDNAFVWRGTGAFTKSPAGELRYQRFDSAGTANDKTIIYGDTDGDTAAEFQIELKGLKTMGGIDFVV